jgi:hypothetical protein
MIAATTIPLIVKLLLAYYVYAYTQLLQTGEPKSALQKALAPRRRPAGRYGTALPLAAMLLLAWLHTLAHTAVWLCLPFVLGRKAFALLHVPSAWAHDPFAFAVGVLAVR